MAELERYTRTPIGRRGFLKTAGGLAVFGGAFVLVGCGNDDDDAPAAVATAAGTTAAGAGGETLYNRLGKQPAIQKVMDEFIPIVGADTRINSFFANTNLDRLKMLLVEQVSAATGGPEKYTGRDMKTAHAGLKIQKVHFDALVEDLGKAMTKVGVPMKEQGEIVAILGPTQPDIVTA